MGLAIVVSMCSSDTAIVLNIATEQKPVTRFKERWIAGDACLRTVAKSNGLEREYQVEVS